MQALILQTHPRNRKPPSPLAAMESLERRKVRTSLQSGSPDRISWRRCDSVLRRFKEKTRKTADSAICTVVKSEWETRTKVVAQTLVCATGLFCGLLFLDRLFGGVGLHGGPGFGRGDDHGFRAPEVHRDFGDFVGRIAELRIEAIESGLSGLDGIGVDLLEFFETLVAEDFTQGRIVVEATHGRAQRGHVARGAFAAFAALANIYRPAIRAPFPA